MESELCTGSQKEHKNKCQDEYVVNIDCTPDAASNNGINQDPVSVNARTFQVFGMTVDSNSENIIPSEAPDKLSDAYFTARQKCISMLNRHFCVLIVGCLEFYSR